MKRRRRRRLSDDDDDDDALFFLWVVERRRWWFFFFQNRARRHIRRRADTFVIHIERERVSKLDKRKGKREMSPMFVPVVDEETPRSEREKKKKGEKENAHSRFHRTHDKSGETFGSSDVDFREEEQMMDFLQREDAAKTMPENSWKGQRVGYFFGRNAKNVLGYHFDGKRHEEDDDVWRQTWVDVMTRTAKEKTLASKANRKKTIEQMQQRKRKVEEDPNDYKRKEKKAPQLTQKERETLALERLKKKREGEHGSSRENRYGNEDFRRRPPQPRDGGRNSHPSSSFGYRRH